VNIVFVNPEYPSRSGQDHGGIATYIYSMANALAQEGNSVHIIAKSSTVPDKLHDNVFFHTINHQPVCRMWSWLDRVTNNDVVWERGYSQSVLKRTLEIHEKSPVDCVEIPDYNGLAYEFSPSLPFPVIIHFHTPTYVIDRYNQKRITKRQRRWYAFEAKALLRAHAFRCPSNWMKNEACAAYGIPGEKVAVIPHPLDTEPFDAIEKTDKKKDVIDILFSGRLERRKGGDILLTRVGRILALDPRINLTLAGELEMGESGNYRSAIERSLDEQQRHRLWLLGPANHSDLPVLYRRSNIFLMPSLFENAPYALLEAMAARLPVVASNTSGIAELIKHEESGMLFDLDKPDTLLERIKHLIDSPDHARTYSQKAYETVKTLCAVKTIALKSIDFYSHVIESFRGRALSAA
jgi:glycosyltransferase involved in cell wall biosynthesis